MTAWIAIGGVFGVMIVAFLVRVFNDFNATYDEPSFDYTSKIPEDFTIDQAIEMFRSFVSENIIERRDAAFITDKELLFRIKDHRFFDGLAFLVNHLYNTKEGELSREIKESLSMLMLGLIKLGQLYQLYSPIQTEIENAERKLKLLKEQSASIKKRRDRSKAERTIEMQEAQLLMISNELSQHQLTIETLTPRTEAILGKHLGLQADLLNIVRALETLLINNLSEISQNDLAGAKDEEMLLIYRSKVEDSVIYGADELDEYLKQADKNG